jgi:hypothetical protein
MRKSYCVAGHRFAIEAKEDLFAQLVQAPENEIERLRIT